MDGEGHLAGRGRAGGSRGHVRGRSGPAADPAGRNRGSPRRGSRLAAAYRRPIDAAARMEVEGAAVFREDNPTGEKAAGANHTAALAGGGAGRSRGHAGRYSPVHQIDGIDGRRGSSQVARRTHRTRAGYEGDDAAGGRGREVADGAACDPDRPGPPGQALPIDLDLDGRGSREQGGATGHAGRGVRRQGLGLAVDVLVERVFVQDPQGQSHELHLLRGSTFRRGHIAAQAALNRIRQEPPVAGPDRAALAKGEVVLGDTPFGPARDRHDVDVAAEGFVLLQKAHPLAVRRERQSPRLGQGAGGEHAGLPVSQAEQVELLVRRPEDQGLGVRGPDDGSFIRVQVGDLLQILAVRVHQIDLLAARAVRNEGDPLAVRRPGGGFVAGGAHVVGDRADVALVGGDGEDLVPGRDEARLPEGERSKLSASFTIATVSIWFSFSSVVTSIFTSVLLPEATSSFQSPKSAS